MASSILSGLGAASALSGSELFYGVQGGLDVKVTGSQLKTLILGAGSLSVASGKTLTVSNTLTISGTDSSSVAFGAGGTVAYLANKLSVFAATTSAELAGVISDETGTGALVFANTPTFVTPVLGVATGTSLALGGATLGGNALAVTGTALFNSALTLGAALTYGGVTLSNAVTGTGNMVLATTPTLTTPVLGVAAATTLALGGATIGAHALAVTGTVNVSGAGTFGGLLTASLGLTVASGQTLKLGNAATTGLVAGVLSGLTNASIVITDSAGQAYRVPCII